jgi:hypothetical protein
MVNLNHLVGKNVHNCCRSNMRDRWGQILPVEMSVPVKNITRLTPANEEVDGLQPLVGNLVLLIVNAVRRRVRDEDI